MFIRVSIMLHELRKCYLSDFVYTELMQTPLFVHYSINRFNARLLTTVLLIPKAEMVLNGNLTYSLCQLWQVFSKNVVNSGYEKQVIFALDSFLTSDYEMILWFLLNYSWLFKNLSLSRLPLSPIWKSDKKLQTSKLLTYSKSV